MTPTKKQQRFLDLISEGKNVFLTGKAGTGKTSVAHMSITQLKKQGKRVAAIAPTGIAANNIGGQTMHSLFSLNPFGVIDFGSCNFVKSEKREIWRAIDVLFIDEVSMLRPDHLDAINWTLIKNGCGSLLDKQVVLIGDMKQLPPVLNDNTRSVLYRTYDGDRYYNSQIYPQLGIHEVDLDEVVRQSDPDFIDALNLIREGQRADYFRSFVGVEPNGGIVLAPHNATVEDYNRRGLAQLNGETFEFTAVVEGERMKPQDFNMEEVVTVKNGAKVMYLINSKDAPLRNGTIGIFVSHMGCHYIRVDEIDYPLEPVKVTKKEYVLDKEKNDLVLKEVGSITQIPIRLAYAVTIHKSQGLTMDEITIDLSKPCFAPEQLYVALSRVTSPQGLRILTGGR